jgi:hypothetical protein
VAYFRRFLQYFQRRFLAWNQQEVEQLPKHLEVWAKLAVDQQAKAEVELRSLLTAVYGCDFAARTTGPASMFEPVMEELRALSEPVAEGEAGTPPATAKDVAYSVLVQRYELEQAKVSIGLGLVLPPSFADGIAQDKVRAE